MFILVFNFDPIRFVLFTETATARCYLRKKLQQSFIFAYMSFPSKAQMSKNYVALVLWIVEAYLNETFIWRHYRYLYIVCIKQRPILTS